MSASNTTSSPAFLEAADTLPVHPTLARRRPAAASSLGLVQTATLVLWTGCAAVGVLGFVLGYTRPSAPVPAPEPVVVEKLDVALTAAPTLVAAATAEDLSSAPPPPSALAQSTPASPIAVADPSTVAFALPVEGPTIVVDRAQASHSRPPRHRPRATDGAGAPSPQTLIYGQGEGRQPAPEYPVSAKNHHQQGTVGVRLTVNREGRVLDASVAAPSPWPILDESALRTVRHRWRFPRGPVRVYDVAIRFALAE